MILWFNYISICTGYNIQDTTLQPITGRALICILASNTEILNKLQHHEVNITRNGC